MDLTRKIIYKDLKPQIADAIKESCYKADARLYNIANEVHHIVTFSVEPGVELAEGLSKIIDKTVKESVGLDCDLSVISKGVLLGAFRASPYIREEAHKTIRILIDEIIQSASKYKGNIKQVVNGIMAAVVIISGEFKFNTQEALIIAKEDLLKSAAKINSKVVDDVKEAIPHLEGPV